MYYETEEVKQKSRFIRILEGIGHFLLLVLVFSILRPLIKLLPINYLPIVAPCLALFATAALARKLGAKIPFIVFCCVALLDTILTIVFAVLESEYQFLIWNVIYALSIITFGIVALTNFESFGE